METSDVNDRGHQRTSLVRFTKKGFLVSPVLHCHACVKTRVVLEDFENASGHDVALLPDNKGCIILCLRCLLDVGHVGCIKFDICLVKLKGAEKA